MAKYIVSDLTRFSTPDKVCIAVIDIETGECLRPMPYLQSSEVKRLQIHPGAILEGEITLKQHVENPHIEDASFENLTYAGPASVILPQRSGPPL